MFLQILPPDFQAAQEPSTIDLQLIIVLVAMAIGVFGIIRIAKYFSKIKTIKKPNFASFF